MAQQKGKKVVVRRRRERKNIENGAVHIQSTFNNTIVTITDTQGHFLGKLWRTGLPRLQKVYAVRCTDRSRNCGKGSNGTRPEVCRSICKGSGIRP